jgi:hypothetical protein
LFIQWTVFSVTGTLAFRAFLRIVEHFHLRPPLVVVVALMPAYFVLGFIFMDIPPSAAASVLDGIAIVVDGVYYGLVLLIVWRELWSLLRQIGVKQLEL